MTDYNERKRYFPVKSEEKKRQIHTTVDFKEHFPIFP